MRRARRLTQDQMAWVTGIPIATYKRLERGELRNPGVRYLINCATVLGCELDELVEEEWLEFAIFLAGGPSEPPPSEWWRHPRAYLAHEQKRGDD